MSQKLKPDRTRIENLEAQLADILYRLGEIEGKEIQMPYPTVSEPAPPKRKRGRPRKHPIAEPDNAA